MIYYRTKDIIDILAFNCGRECDEIFYDTRRSRAL